VFEDRGKRALVRGGVETWIESLRFLSTEAQADREMIGSAGDRIALERIVWTGAGFEIELILLTEVDAEGRLLRSIRFDPDDRRAAFDEMGVRFATGEGAEAPRTLIGRAFNDHDWETHRDSFAPDAVAHDHRPLSLGVVTRDEYTQSARAWAEMAPDVGVEVLRIIAWNRHGRVFLSRAFGTVRDGGPFENFFVGLHLCDGDRIQRLEFFDVDAANAALARFAELCAE